MTNFIKAIQVANDSGLTLLVISTIYLIFNSVIPLIKQKHGVSTVTKHKQALDLLEKAGQAFVMQLSTQYEKTSQEKKAIADGRLAEFATRAGLPVSQEIISAIIESCYQHMTTLDTNAQANQVQYNKGLEAAKSQFEESQNASEDKPEKALDVPEKPVGGADK